MAMRIPTVLLLLGVSAFPVLYPDHRVAAQMIWMPTTMVWWTAPTGAPTEALPTRLPR
jgi:hypothetical protein